MSATTELPIETLNELSNDARTLTIEEFDLLKQVFLRAGGNDIGRSIGCAKKAEELMDAITKRTGIGFEQYT